jgi:hypothetical protein
VSNINLRDVPEPLFIALKKKAAASQKFFGQFCIEVLQSSLVLREDGIVDDGYQVTCPMCGQTGPLVRFGMNAKCYFCGSGFVPPTEAE